ncbi:LOW QUALITY PROTEIN: uncharacterized protein [Atheta coriaria]|uniref:LOW QUALITY PROTEIN: uncharacterized protein n=1 Tax=Dalotia coriaria TaxID=877792 RepID=UPI0031F3F308
MELTQDLIAIQNIIGECERQVGTLAEIKHKGGNESKIELVVNKIKQFLLSKSYITDPPNLHMRNNASLEKIILFLILNTKLNDDTLANIKEYSHLINIMPKCSKFLLINIAIETELIDIYGKVAIKLPLQIVSELFEAANDTFINGHGGKTLKNVNIIVSTLIEKVNSTDIQDNHVFDNIRNINNIIVKLLMYLSVHPSISLTNATDTERDLHIGYTLHKLFKMLLLVNEVHMGCGKIVDALVMTTSIVMKQVTVNVFCTWAEIEEDDLPFQYAIGTEAYRVVEKYAKVKPAAELISLLTCMAKKPKSLSEIISGASVTSIVNHINDADEHQRRWFAALVRKSDIFDIPTSRECLQRWSALCTLDEVLSILELAMSKDESCKRLAIKCAAHLSVPNLSTLIARSFWIDQPWKTYIELTSVQPQLTLLLNKMQNGCNEELIRNIQLLLLENPQEVIEILFRECIKTEVYVKWLEDVFRAIKNVISMNFIPLMKLEQIIKTLDELKENEQSSITQLMHMLIRTECTEVNHLFTYVFKPLILSAQDNNENLDVILQILKSLPVESLNETHKEELAIELINNLEKHRVKYSDFCARKIGICTSSTSLLTQISGSFEDMNEVHKSELNKLNSYYLTLTGANSYQSLLNYVFPNFVIDSYGQQISKLLKMLSRCVTQEWLQITEEVATTLGMQKAAESLTDVLILICEVTNTQGADNKPVFTALSYYLSNYGICIQKMREKDISLQFEAETVKNICRLIKMLPQDIKYQEGVNLINLFSEKALQSLSKDRQFVAALVALGNDKLSQIIANKMLEIKKQ